MAAPRQRVWEALNDPQVLQASIPGCQSLEKEGEDRFNATVEVKIGPIGARFKGRVQLTDLDPPNGYTIVGDGSGGIAGSAKGNARVRLTEDGDGTLVSYEVEAQVGGRLAQLGGPIIDATAKQLAGKFFSRFGEIVSGAQPGATTAAPSADTVAMPAPALQSPAPAPTTHAAPPAINAPSPGLPVAWILGLAVAALAGFLIGQSGGDADTHWAGLAIGLLAIVVAAAGFEHGRRTAAPVVVLDSALLRRLIDGAGK